LKKPFFLILVLSFLPVISLDAEEIPPPPDPGAEAGCLTQNAVAFSLDEVVVTATRSKRPASEIPASVSVISRGDIAVSPAQNVDDLLRTLPGLDVKRVTGLASGIPSRLSIRGVPGSNRTLVLMDGVPMNAAGTGFMSTNEIPLDTVERVEVVRGPFSSLYGSNAFGGVVNVLTRDPLEKTSGSISSSLGNARYQAASAFFSSSSDLLLPLGLFLQVDTRSIQNYLVRNSALDRSWDAANEAFVTKEIPEVNHDYQETRAFGKAVLKPAASTRVTLHGQLFRDRLGYGQTAYLNVPQDNEIENHSGLGAIHVESALSPKWALTGGGYGRRRFEHIVNESYSRMNPFPPFPIYERTYSDTVYVDWQGKAQALFCPSASHRLTFGSEVLLNEGRFEPTRLSSTGEALNGKTGNHRSIHNQAFYVQEEALLGNHWVLVPGLRLDRSSANPCVASPKAGILFKVSPRLRWRASAGRSFRAPTLSELYMPDVSSIPGILLKSNPGLKPEHLNAYDVGGSLNEGGKLEFGVDAFFNTMQNLISTLRSGSTMTYVNVDRVFSTGMDSSIIWRPRGGWKLSLNHTAQWVEDRSTGQILDYTPRNKGNASLSASRRFGVFLLEGSLEEFISGARYYTDSQTKRKVRLGSYVDTNLGFKISHQAGFGIGVRVTNFFDAKYEETGEVWAPGRLVVFSSEARF